MTKLEELEAAVDSAYDAACDTEEVFSDRWDDFHDAQKAYQAELKKQEETE